jgi:hypothetical protein
MSFFVFPFSPSAQGAYWLLPVALWHRIGYTVPIDRRGLAHIIHETVSRDREDGCATGKPQGLELEAHLNSTSQGSRPEDARKDGHLRGRSSRFVNNMG